MIIGSILFFQCTIGTADNLYKPFDTLLVFLKEFFEKVNFETVDDNKSIKIPNMQRVNDQLSPCLMKPNVFTWVKVQNFQKS